MAHVHFYYSIYNGSALFSSEPLITISEIVGNKSVFPTRLISNLGSNRHPTGWCPPVVFVGLLTP